MLKFQTTLPQIILECRKPGGTWRTLDDAAVRSFNVASRVNRLASAVVVLQERQAQAGTGREDTAGVQAISLSSSEELRPGNGIRISFRGTSEPLRHLRDLFQSPEPVILFQGIITEHAVKAMRNGHTQLTLEARHDAIALAHLRQGKVFPPAQASLSQMANALLADLGLPGSLVEVGGTEEPATEPAVMYNVTAWDFLLMRAESLGMLAYCTPGKVTFLPIHERTAETELLSTSSDDLFEYELSLSGRRLFNGVDTLSWDAASQQAVQESLTASEAAALTPLLDADRLAEVGHAMAAGAHPAVPVPGALPADAYRRSLVLRSALSAVRGSIVTRGTLGILPGQWLGLRGFGATFNGGAFVAGVTHQGSEAGWLTQVELGLQPDCFSRYHDVVEEPVGGTNAPMRGLHIGVVQQTTEDSTGMHRVQVLIPYLGLGGNPASQELIWARLASPDAGDGHGLFFRPRPGDEVILGFLNEDPNAAIILGSLTSAAASRQPAAYASQEEARSSAHDLQGIRTPAGIQILMDEDKGAVTVTTPKGMKILLSDDEESISLQDADGNEVVMDGKGILLSTGGGLSRKPLRIQAGDVEIDCDGSFTVNAGQDFSLSGMGIAPNMPLVASSGGSVSINGQQIKLG